MFLKQTMNMNKVLIDYAVEAHQDGKLLPDTYLIDMDSLLNNAKRILEKADQYDINLYFMLKQVGRNPYIAQKLIDIGYKSAVVVDFKEALAMMRHNIPIGNVGHLVQVPMHLLERIMKYGVEYITVFSMDILYKIEKIAQKHNIIQKVMIRVVGSDDALYAGQVGGVKLEKLGDFAKELKKFKHIELDALTAFPSLLFDKNLGKIKVNPNVQTMNAAEKILDELGFLIKNRNMPSVTSLLGLDTLKEIGATQGEPGHALTGTTPVNAMYSEYEVPSLIYLSEISHNFNNKSYFYGGGLYRRGHMENVLIVEDGEENIEKFNDFPNDSIDYYFDVDGYYHYGSTVIMAFRTQIFVTRSNIAIIEGLRNGNPSIVGIYDSQGNVIGDD